LIICSRSGVSTLFAVGKDGADACGKSRGSGGNSKGQPAISGSGVMDHAHGSHMTGFTVGTGQLAYDIHMGFVLKQNSVWDRVFAVASGDRDLEEVFFDSTAIRCGAAATQETLPLAPPAFL
jgi:hypothetical protein